MLSLIPWIWVFVILRFVHPSIPLSSQWIPLDLVLTELSICRSFMFILSTFSNNSIPSPSASRIVMLFISTFWTPSSILIPSSRVLLIIELRISKSLPWNKWIPWSPPPSPMSCKYKFLKIKLFPFSIKNPSSVSIPVILILVKFIFSLLYYHYVIISK